MFPTPKPVAPLTGNTTAGRNRFASRAHIATPITVTINTVQAVIDEKSGGLRKRDPAQMSRNNDDENKPFICLATTKEYYVAQIRDFLDAQGSNLFKGIGWRTEKQYGRRRQSWSPPWSAAWNTRSENRRAVMLSPRPFSVSDRFDIVTAAVKPQPGGLRIVRDHGGPRSGYFTHSYVRPTVYTLKATSKKSAFSAWTTMPIRQIKGEYIRKTPAKLARHDWTRTHVRSQPKGGQSVCAAGPVQHRHQTPQRQAVQHPASACLYTYLKRRESWSLHGLCNKPARYIRHRKQIADNLQLAKDCGKVHWFASPLFGSGPAAVSSRWGWAVIV